MNVMLCICVALFELFFLVAISGDDKVPLSFVIVQSFKETDPAFLFHAWER